MRRKKILLPVIVFAFVFSLTFSLHSQDKEKTIFGSFMIGYRSVDTTGALNKYKEDINLDDGVRLFNFSLHINPTEKLKNLFDRIDMNVYNFGGDPFETFGLSIQKYGKYKFQYDRKKSTYFYGDLHEIEAGQLYDHHTFNFDRVMDSAFLKIWLTKNVDLYLNYDRFTKKGDSVTTFDIDRIEFEFDKPIKEESNEFTVGVSLHLNRYSLILEEKFMDYETSNSLFLPGYADGGAGAQYPSALNSLYLNQPYELDTNMHKLKFNARPLDNLLITGSAQISDQDMNLRFSEDAEGITYLGSCYTYSFNGEGSFERKIRMYDFDISYLLFGNLAIIGAVRYHNFDQEGSLSIGSETKPASLDFDTLGFEGGLQYQFSPQFAVTFGYRNEARNLGGTETVDFEEKTQRNGIFGNLKADISQRLKLTLDYQHGEYDDPYTLISPSNFDRFRGTAKLQDNQFDASGSYLFEKSKNEIFAKAWESTKHQVNLRIGHHTEYVKIFAGYSYIDIERKGNRNVYYPPSWSGPAGTFLWEILYEGKSKLLDVSLSLNTKSNWKIGAYANRYTNKGFWEISRTMLKGYLEYTFDNGLSAQLGYRYVKFEEASSGFNDYRANIYEISFGHRWE